MLIYLKHDAHDKIDEVVRAALKQVILGSMNSHVFIDTAWGTYFTMSAQDARRKYGVRIDTMSAYNPPIRHAWEMTYDELLGELESLNSVVDRAGLDRLRPLLAEVYPEYVDVDYRDYTQDPWGIGRAIQAGTEIPRAPTVDLSQRLRKLKEQHGIEHNPPDAGETLIGTSEDRSLEFHLVEGDVYRVKAGWSPDVYGLPMGMRWECSLEHWNRYRNSVFSWVIDAGDLDPGGEE
jgi:hypothetical protein